MTDVEGTIYLIHFDQPFGHAKHYLGWASPGNLDRRIEHHRQGTGSNLMKHVTRAGIGWQVVKTWPGTRTEERRMKKHSSTRYCPVCNAERHVR